MAFSKKLIVVKIVFIAVSHLFDLMKDCLILVEISNSQGGIRELMNPARPLIIKLVTKSQTNQQAQSNRQFFNFRFSLQSYLQSLFQWCWVAYSSYRMLQQSSLTSVTHTERLHFFWLCHSIPSMSLFKS